MKYRIVYTVIRDLESAPSVMKDLVRSFQAIKDEPGEYLYGGGVGLAETVEAKLQVSDDGKVWHDVAVP